jgi:hypothetical protein
MMLKKGKKERKCETRQWRQKLVVSFELLSSARVVSNIVCVNAGSNPHGIVS